MIKQLILFLILFYLILVPLKSKASWELIFQPRQRVVKTIAIFNDLIFIGTGNGVFVSKDERKTWKDFGSNQLLKSSDGNSVINWISIDEPNEKIYIATNFGAYYSDINNPDWHKLFESTKAGSTTVDLTTEDIDLVEEGNNLSDIEEDDFSQTGQINSITIGNDQAYLSTNDGFWKCNFKKNSCNRQNLGLKVNNESGNHEVFYVLKNNNNLFLAASNGIYFLDQTDLTWKESVSGIQKLPDGRLDARHLLVDEYGNLWAACGTGVYFSSNKGISWEKRSNGIEMNNEGFQEAFYLLESKGKDQKLYVACASGIYYLDKKQNLWQNISEGIRTKESSKKVYWLAALNDDLFAATDEGLFAANETQTKSSRDKVTLPLLKGKIQTDFAGLEELEPSVVEVQKQALKFAALPTSNDYKRYRMQARLRNLVPRVGFDTNTTGTNTNYFQFQNDISTNPSLNNDYNAGNTKRFQHDGKLYKQLSVSWDTNQFVYDDAIWRILNQARLTANIKENLLDDVTRIYYQRRKLQLENIISIQVDPISKIEKEIEVAELTGQLDSRTGGWFSREIEKRKQILVDKK